MGKAFLFFSFASANVCLKSMWKISSKHLPVLFLVAIIFREWRTLLILTLSAPINFKRELYCEVDGVKTELWQTSNTLSLYQQSSTSFMVWCLEGCFVVASHLQGHCYFHILLAATTSWSCPLLHLLFIYLRSKTTSKPCKCQSLDLLSASIAMPRKMTDGVKEQSL